MGTLLPRVGNCLLDVQTHPTHEDNAAGAPLASRGSRRVRGDAAQASLPSLAVQVLDFLSETEGGPGYALAN